MAERSLSKKFMLTERIIAKVGGVYKPFFSTWKRAARRSVTCTLSLLSGMESDKISAKPS
jgi:hypothetical protein